MPPVARSADPEQFARNVATTLFAWDTTTGLLPLDYTSTILAVGTPAAPNKPGSLTTSPPTCPRGPSGQDPREYGTSQHLTIDRANVPDQRGEAIAQAPEGQLAHGTIA